MTESTVQKSNKRDLIAGLAERCNSHRTTVKRIHKALIDAGLLPPRAGGRVARPLQPRDGTMLLLVQELADRVEDYTRVLRAAWSLPLTRRAPDLPAGELPVVVAGDADVALAAQVVRDAIGEVEAAAGAGTFEPFGAALDSLAGPAASRLVDRRVEALAGACGRLDATVRLFGPDPLSAEIEIIAEIDPPGGPYVCARRTLEYGGTGESSVVEKLIALRDDPHATDEERAEARRALARRVRETRPRTLASVGLDDILTIARLIEGGARRNGG